LFVFGVFVCLFVMALRPSKSYVVCLLVCLFVCLFLCLCVFVSTKHTPGPGQGTTATSRGTNPHPVAAARSAATARAADASGTAACSPATGACSHIFFCFWRECPAAGRSGCVCLFVCLFVCFFVCLFVCLFVCQDIDEWETGNEWYKRVLQSTGQAYCCLCWTARLFVCLFVCLFVYLCVFVCLYCNLSGAAGVGTTLRALGTYSGEAKTIACQRMPQSACTASA
jgi:hypothetical protein